MHEHRASGRGCHRQCVCRLRHRKRNTLREVAATVVTHRHSDPPGERRVTRAGYRVMLFVVTVIGILALLAVVSSLADINVIGLVSSSIILAGCVSLIL